MSWPLVCVSFCLQFLPHTGDRILVTGAADTKVHVHDLSVKETIHMFSDHTNRVKRIATAPMWPNTFWSAAEDGIIRWESYAGQLLVFVLFSQKFEFRL